MTVMRCAANHWCVLSDRHEGECRDKSAQRILGVVEGLDAKEKNRNEQADELAKRIDELREDLEKYIQVIELASNTTVRLMRRVEALEISGALKTELAERAKVELDELLAIKQNHVDVGALEDRFRTKIGKVHDSSIAHKTYLNNKVDEIIERLENFASRMKKLERGRR